MHNGEEYKLQKVLDLLKNDTKRPRCQHINELGVLAILNKNAEKELCKLLLKETGENEKCAAFGYLSIIKNKDQETIDALEKFRANPENSEFIKFAEEVNNGFEFV